MDGNPLWNQGRNPLVNYNFMLRVELLFDLPCKSVKAFTREMEYEIIQEGGLNDYVHMRRKPISKPFTLEIERYVGIEYFDPIPNGADLVLPLLLYVSRDPIELTDLIPGVVKRMYVFTGCTVIKKTYGELDGSRSGLLVETTTIAYREMLAIDAPWSDAANNAFNKDESFQSSLERERALTAAREKLRAIYVAAGDLMKKINEAVGKMDRDVTEAKANPDSKLDLALCGEKLAGARASQTKGQAAYTAIGKLMEEARAAEDAAAVEKLCTKATAEKEKIDTEEPSVGTLLGEHNALVAAEKARLEAVGKVRENAAAVTELHAAITETAEQIAAAGEDQMALLGTLTGTAVTALPALAAAQKSAQGAQEKAKTQLDAAAAAVTGALAAADAAGVAEFITASAAALTAAAPLGETAKKAAEETNAVVREFDALRANLASVRAIGTALADTAAQMAAQLTEQTAAQAALGGAGRLDLGEMNVQLQLAQGAQERARPMQEEAEKAAQAAPGAKDIAALSALGVQIQAQLDSLAEPQRDAQNAQRTNNTAVSLEEDRLRRAESERAAAAKKAEADALRAKQAGEGGS